MSPYEIIIDDNTRLVVTQHKIIFEYKATDAMGERYWQKDSELRHFNCKPLLAELHRLQSIAGARQSLVLNSCAKCGRSLALSSPPLLCALCASVVNPPLPDPRPHGIHPDPQIWVQTFTGRKVYPFALSPESVCIDDIAHALSNICRFTGHTKTFYSVAQHSVLCSLNCPAYALPALLHNAAEAYIGDIARPLKRAYAGIAEIEDNILRAIYRAFDITYTPWATVQRIDDILLATEARDLLRVDLSTWPDLSAKPLPMEIIPWTPDRAQQEFLRRFQELTAKVSD